VSTTPTAPMGAATDVYIAGSGNWSTPTNWSLGQPPLLPGDDAILQAGTNSLVVVTFDANANATKLGSLAINSTTAGSVALLQSLNTLISQIENVGSNGAGTYNQNGGMNQASALYLGFGSGGAGTYNLSNGATLDVGTVEE